MQLPQGQQPTATTNTTHSEHPDTHYQHLKNVIPEWLGKASHARRQALKRTQPQLLDRLKAAPATQHTELKPLNAAHWTAQNEVDRKLEHLQDASGFAEPLLRDALRSRFGLDLDVRKTFLRLYIPATIPWFPVKSGAARTWTVSLLDAALHNFEDKETEDGAYEPDSTFITEPSSTGQFDPLPLVKDKITLQAFTRLCRELDIGAQYKIYLEENLGISNPVVAATLRPKVEESQKAALKAALQFARMNGDIQEDYFRLIQGLLDGLQGMRLNGKDLLRYDLTMMSAKLTGIVLFAPNLEQQREPVRVVYYIPDDPEHPIKEYSSTAEFTKELTRQLRSADYQRFFSRFVSHEHRGYFFANLSNRLAKVTWHHPVKGSPLPTWRETAIDNPALQLCATPFNDDVWQHLYQAKLNKILDDARVIAVSTESADQKARWELWDSFTKVLSTILEIASFVALPFVPFLGELMLAYMAWQLLDEAFEGIIDWAQGLTTEALEHLMGTVESLVQLGAFAAGGAIAVGEFRQVLPAEVVKFIDRFKPVQAPNGKTLYWKPDLTPYEQKTTVSKGSRSNRLGLHQHEGKSILPIGDTHYCVSEDPRTGLHRIEHPTRPDAYKPLLRHNGDGAWHTELEQPLEWDTPTALRRIGHSVESFSPARREQILKVSGCPENALRKMHVNRESLPPLLADTIKRFKIDQELQRFADQMASHLPEHYLSADPLTQLQMLKDDGLWPGSKRLRLLNEQGEIAWESSIDENLPLTEIRQGRLNDGDLLKTLLQTLSESEVKTLLGEEFGSPMIALDIRTKTLRTKLAQIASKQRASRFESHYKALEHSENPLVQNIVQADPELPASVAQELLNTATGSELQQISKGQLPERLNQLAGLARQEVRVTRAYEGLELNSVKNPDTDILALHSLERLPGWSREVRIEVRDQSYEAQTLDSTGHQDAPIQKVLVRQTNGTWQSYDNRGQELHGAADFYSSILQALPDAERRALDINIGQGDKLKQAIRAQPLERNELRTAISHQPIREPVVDTLRLLGSEGYPRVTGEHPRTLEERVQEVYPRLPPEEIRALVQRLQSHPAGPRAELSRLRNEYFQLVNDLHIWANNPPRFHPQTNARLSSLERTAELQNRRLFREEILRCWRRETDLYDEQSGAEYGYTLKFSEPILGDLPVLTADFSHISMLSLDGSRAVRATDSFLARFPGLRRLEMCNFALENLPQAISTMPALDELILSNCGIVLTPESQATLSSLSNLVTLNLYRNPLGLVPGVEAMPRLAYIDLSSTGISSVPAGLSNHPQLGIAILNDNQITEVPAALFDLPGNIGEGFDFGNNPLSSMTRERIKTYYRQTKQDLGVWAEQADIDRTKALYPSLDNEEASDFIYRLPGTLDEGRIELTRREAELSRLINDLTAWAADIPAIDPITGNPLDAMELLAEQLTRNEFKQNLERCWRRIPTANVVVGEYGFVSHLSIMGDLPVLTADFSHVPALYLTSAGDIAPRASRFLEYFPNLDSLAVRGYQLDNIPEAVFRMGRLRVLSLPDCRITLTQETLNALAGMEHLDHLNLRDNPLGLTPDLSNMADISSLDLDHTGITEIPRGLLSLNTGAEVDLSHNAITEIPADVLELPPETAEGFNFNGNPLDEASLERLIAYCRRTGIDFGIDAVSERAEIEVSSSGGSDIDE
jgi:Leucine-rich repeat (LRR) protein